MADMAHLSGDELVDLVEGIVSDADMPHLTSCDRCRNQLADLRAARAMASEIGVPEPSPLFWDHFSARVRDAVANEPAPRDGWWPRLWSWPGVLAPVSAAAAIVLVAALVFRASTSVSEPARPGPAVAANSGLSPTSTLELLGDSITTDDASLALVADLTDGIEWDAAADAGLAPDGSAEHAVTHMSAGELQQLASLLQAEMSRKGA